MDTVRKNSSFDDLFRGALDSGGNGSSIITDGSQKQVDDMHSYSPSIELGDFSSSFSGEVLSTVPSILTSGAGDTAKSSPCSPTISSFLPDTDLSIITSRRQRSYSVNGDIFSTHDIELFEDLDRGSQISLDDQDIFDFLGRKKPESETLSLPISKSCLEDAESILQGHFNVANSVPNGPAESPCNGSSALKQLLLSSSPPKKQVPKVIKLVVCKSKVDVNDPSSTQAQTKSISTSKTVSSPSGCDNSTPPVYTLQFQDGRGDQPINVFLPAGVTIENGTF